VSTKCQKVCREPCRCENEARWDKPWGLFKGIFKPNQGTEVVAHQSRCCKPRSHAGAHVAEGSRKASRRSEIELCRDLAALIRTPSEFLSPGAAELQRCPPSGPEQFHGLSHTYIALESSIASTAGCAEERPFLKTTCPCLLPPRFVRK
jgi:hypothetical protein